MGADGLRVVMAIAVVDCTHRVVKQRRVGRIDDDAVAGCDSVRGDAVRSRNTGQTTAEGFHEGEVECLVAGGGDKDVALFHEAAQVGGVSDVTC